MIAHLLLDYRIERIVHENVELDNWPHVRALHEAPGKGEGLVAAQKISKGTTHPL